MLKERNQRGRDRSDLIGGDVDKVNILLFNDRIIGQVPNLNAFIQEISGIVKWRGGLGNYFVFLFFRTQVNRILIHLNLTVYNTLVRCFNKTKPIDLSINAKRRDKTDIRAFRCFNGTQTTIMGIMHVADLETGTFAR